jgi:hypothetical protein
MGDNGLLSQEEVDALFKQATGKTVERAPAFVASAPELAAKTMATAPAPRQAPSPTTPLITPRPVMNAPAEFRIAPLPPKAITPPVVVPVQTVRTTVSPRPAIPPTPTPARQSKPAPNQGKVVSITASDLQDIQSALIGMSQRLGNMDNRLTKLEHETAKSESPKIKQLVNEVRTITGQIERIQIGLSNTPDYNLRAEFECENCGSKGTVATRQRCTQCEKEGWWGWWPKKKN